VIIVAAKKIENPPVGGSIPSLHHLNTVKNGYLRITSFVAVFLLTQILTLMSILHVRIHIHPFTD
jgi:hypothetical protein